MKKLTLTLGLLIGLTAHNVQAQTNGMEARRMNTECMTPGHNIDNMFAKMDANKDGKLEKDEACGHLQDNFGLIDINADGFLSTEEVKSIAQQHSKGCMPMKLKPDQLEKMFDRMDSNKDGQLEKTEVGKHLLNNYDLVDTNSNGYISKEEFMAAPIHHSKQVTKTDMRPRDLDEMLERMDTNGDGKLEKKELGKHLRDNFNVIDSDNDGFISKEEFRVIPEHQNMMQHKRERKTPMGTPHMRRR